MPNRKLTIKAKKVQEEFLRSLKIAKRKTKKSVIVAMVGLVGSGKSSIARELAKLIGTTVVANDQIRIYLRKYGERFELARVIAENVAKAIIKKGGNVVLDSDFIEVDKRKELLRKVKVGKIKVVFVRTFSDRDVMIDRLCKAKYPKGGFFKNATIALREMWRRTPHHYQWTSQGGGNWLLKKLPFVDFEIDTTDGKKWKSRAKKIATILKK